MPHRYQDPSGCLWTEHYDDEGYAFYLNESTQESAWELPPSCTSVGTEEAGSPTALVPAFGDDASPSCWIEVLDESTNNIYFYNTTTQESRWELDAAGLDNVVVGNNAHVEWETHGGSPVPNEVVSLTAWKDEILSSFQVPPTVSEAIGNAGSVQVWPLCMVDNRPSRLERWDVLKAACPNREHFSSSAEETWHQHHPEFEPKLCFYAFDAAVEHVERYWVEVAEAPFRSRLQRDRLRFSRDVSSWEKKASARGVTSAAITRDEEDHSRRVYHEGATREDNEGAAFFAFPLMVHNSKAHHVDWTSGPDRYQVTREAEPEWGWMRIFTFYAYAASKYHVLETTESPMAQKVVKGNFLKPERGWKCVLAFYAFDDNVPGSNRYFVEEKDEPYLRTRIGMAPSCRWGARYDFAAFDIGVPGSCALHVHYSVRATNSLDAQPEQCRISLQDPCGMWAHKFRFYAYPASNVLLAPLDEDVDAVSASLAYGGSSVDLTR